MKVTIQSIHFTAADRLKSYIQKKCDKLDQFFDRIIEGTVVLKVQQEVKNANKHVEIKLMVPGDLLIAKEEAKTFEAAVDLATDKLKLQLKKYKEKIRSREAI
ncbi:MAG: ribosome-associated translation inhibitor RaiA [Bacteroidetes bacterium]|nr:MAG: ribosome-associated translation inhibitor RaiA [Bacteroidota bacterium]